MTNGAPPSPGDRAPPPEAPGVRGTVVPDGGGRLSSRELVATPNTWISDEPTPVAVSRSVLARALRRPLRVLLVTMTMTVSIVIGRILLPPTHHATLYFRLAEGEVTDWRHAPQPPAAIREYISGVALSRNRLEQIMRKHKLSTTWLARDPVAAVDAFRENIEIEVSRNYFVFRRSDDAPRSAQVEISLFGPDADQTRAALHDIGDAILQEQIAARSLGLDEARAFVTAELERTRAHLRSLQDTMTSLSVRSDRTDLQESIGVASRIGTLRESINVTTDQIFTLERRRAEITRSAAAEQDRLGLVFHLYDERMVTRRAPLPPMRLARFAVLAFAVTLLLTVSVLGAFDDRVHFAADLLDHGYPLFGAFPRFPGDLAGSYQTRRH